MTYNVLMGTLNPTHSLTHTGMHSTECVTSRVVATWYADTLL